MQECGKRALEDFSLQIFWNEPLADEIQGLDVLGVRGRDQAIEEQLVNGITTVSFRARYFTILPWSIGAFLKSRLDEEGRGTWDEREFTRYLRRVEFLTLACTAEDEPQRPQINGALGRDLFSDNLRELQATGHAAIPETTPAVFLTYYGPCRAAGLLHDAFGSFPPYTLTDMGKQVLEVREEGIAPEVLNYLSSDKPLSHAIVKLAQPWFSLHSVSFNAKERRVLLDAFATPRASDASAKHKKFLATVDWVQTRLRTKPSSSEWLLIHNYSDKVRHGGSGDVSDEWAEYEWQRRCHFCFEWLLAILGKELNESSDSSISEIVGRLTSTAKFDERYFSSLRQGELGPASTIRTLKDALNGDVLLSAPLPTREMAGTRREDGAISAVAFLILLSTESFTLRRDGIFATRESVINRAMSFLDRADATTVSDALETLLSQCVVIPHLTTTLRKMGEGQRCSLRFFPDGALLRPTGIETTPNRSGTRLSNVLGVFSDLSVFEFADGVYSNGSEVFV